jgi:hypothetical protein
MLTEFLIIQPDGTEETRQVLLAAEPSLSALAAIIQPIIGDGQDFEHVAVLHDGKRTDMFVNENGLLMGLPRNPGATVIYRNNWMSSHPKDDPESLNFIVGPAVLFRRRVWF